MKKITFDSMPEAISELIIKISKLEKLLSGKESGLKKKKTKQGKTAKKSIKAGKTAKAKKPARISKDLLNLQQASRLLKISSSNLYAYVKGKKIPFKKDGRRLYFSKPELEKWNKKRGAANVKAKGKTGDAITVTDAAKLLNISAVTLYYHIKKQKIPVVLKKGKSLFYSKKALLDVVGSKLRKKQNKPSKPQVKAAKTAKPAKSAKPAKPAKTAKSAKPAKTASVSKPAKKTETSGKSKKTVPAKTSKEATPAKEVKQLKPAKKAAKVKQAKPKVKAAKKPVQPKQPVQAPVENEQSKPVELPEPPSTSQDQNNLDS